MVLSNGIGILSWSRGIDDKDWISCGKFEIPKWWNAIFPDNTGHLSDQVAKGFSENNAAFHRITYREMENPRVDDEGNARLAVRKMLWKNDWSVITKDDYSE
jgi:hypothetical protein